MTEECGYFAEEREYMVVEHGNMILMASVFAWQIIPGFLYGHHCDE